MMPWRGTNDGASSSKAATIMRADSRGGEGQHQAQIQVQAPTSPPHYIPFEEQRRWDQLEARLPPHLRRHGAHFENKHDRRRGAQNKGVQKPRWERGGGNGGGGGGRN